MKRFILLLLFACVLANVASAKKNPNEQAGNDRFAIKAQYFMGFYIDTKPHIDKLNPGHPMGLNLGIEFPSAQQRPWQQYLQNPSVGLGMTYLDFGDEMMGQAIALYPYIMLNGLRVKHFELKVKLAAGLAVVNEHWYTQDDTSTDHYYEPTTNTIFGSYLNAYLSAGLNLNFPITRNLAINSEFGFIHMCNGRMAMPNVGANIFYGGVGAIATINPEVDEEPIHFPDLPYKWSLNITASTGVVAADIEDQKFMMASFHTGAIYNVCNWYGVGAGLDVFYNGEITKDTRRTLYSKKIDYTTADKMRVGLALNNEFKFGVVTALLDWGVYLYNPSRNYFYDYVEQNGLTKRPLFYKSAGPGTEQAFHYIRFGARCRVWDNIYVQALAKLHMQICEYVELGIGYQIPFLKKSERKKGESIVYHNHKNWWKE